MKMTKEEAVEMLNDKKVNAGEFTKEIQEKLFEIGFEWVFSGKKIRDFNFMHIKGGKIENLSTFKFYIDCESEAITISQILNIKLEPKCEFNHGLNDNTILDAIDEFNSALDNAVNNIKYSMEKAILSSLISNSIKKLSDDISKIEEIFNKQ